MITLPPNYIDSQRDTVKTHFSKGYDELVYTRAREFASNFPPTSTISILDLGCRRGYALEGFMEVLPHARVVGVDIVPEFADEARTTGAEVHCQDMHDLSLFKDGEFDWIFTSHSIEHCYDIPRAIGEIQRISRAGIFAIMPIEEEKDATANPSHYYHTTDPIDWLRLFQHHDWLMVSASVTLRCEVIVSFSRAKLVKKAATP